MRFLTSRSVSVLGLLLLLTACGDSSSSPSETPLPGSGGLVDFSGTIESVSSGSLAVDGRSFLVDEQTLVFREKMAISVSDLRPGDFVVLKARQRRDAAWMAREIRVRVDA